MHLPFFLGNVSNTRYRRDNGKRHICRAVDMPMLLSIVTPTWNRKHTLHRVWDSLCRQAASHFEWIVVDDGSTDNTDELVRAWQAVAPFPVHYYRRSRVGKNAALNFVKTQIEGRFVVNIDSDDAFLDDAVTTIIQNIERYFSARDDDLAGIAFPFLDEHGTRLCADFPAPAVHSTFLEQKFIYNLHGEIMYVFKREANNNINYIEIPPPDHAPESIAYARANLLCIFVDTPIACAFRHDGEVRLTDPHPRSRIETQSSKSSIAKKRYLISREPLISQTQYLCRDPAFFWKSAITMSTFCFYFGIPVATEIRHIPSWTGKVLFSLAIPIGLLKLPLYLMRYGCLDRRWTPPSCLYSLTNVHS